MGRTRYTFVMPVHDWTRVHAGEFQAFHNGWIWELQRALNGGLLPNGFYALNEQQTSEAKPDVLTLERRDFSGDNGFVIDDGPEGGVAVAEAPPQATLEFETELESLYAAVRKTLVVRHTNDDRPVALVEIASPGNKDRRASVEDFVDKCVGAMNEGLHLIVIDLFPPRRNDPGGLACVVADHVGIALELPENRPLAAVSFRVAGRLRAYAEPLAAGVAMPTLPLFYDPEWYVNLPLQPAYDSAFAGMPSHLRRSLASD